MKSNNSQNNNPEPTLPRLKDPRHPGMLLVSRIALFSATLFAVLLALLAIAGERVTLDFEITADASLEGNKLIIDLEEQKATIFEMDEVVTVTLGELNYELSVIDKAPAADGGYTVVLSGENTGFTSTSDTGRLTVDLLVQQSLKDFLYSKLSF